MRTPRSSKRRKDREDKNAPLPQLDPLRSFEVSRIVGGRGLYVEELDECGGRSKPIWIDDPEAAEWLEVGSLFAISMPPGEPLQVPHLWSDCPLCREGRHGQHR